MANASWLLSSTFTGFALAEDQTNTTLSTTDSTQVAVEVSVGTTTENIPLPVCIGGGFKVVDASTGDVITDLDVSVLEACVDPANTLNYYVQLLVGPDPEARTISVRAYATYACFAGGGLS